MPDTIGHPVSFLDSRFRGNDRLIMKLSNPIAILGEDYACEYLRKNGYKIIERNFRKGYGEIDIIAIDKPSGSGEKILVFVEVKTRTSGSFGSPLEAITYWKLKSLIKTAQYYKMIHPKLPDSLRIDAVSVVLSGENKIKNMEHIKNFSGF